MGVKKQGVGEKSDTAALGRKSNTSEQMCSYVELVFSGLATNEPSDAGFLFRPTLFNQPVSDTVPIKASGSPAAGFTRSIHPAKLKRDHSGEKRVVSSRAGDRKEGCHPQVSHS